MTATMTFTAIMSSKQGNTFHNFIAPKDTPKEQLETIGKTFETDTEKLYAVIEAISNIEELGNGLVMAYEKEGICDTQYIAECNECGEEFATEFYAPSTYTQEQLKQVGQEVANTWGAVCTGVYKA
jgi:hypothetical protein